VCGQSVCALNVVQCRTLLVLVKLASEFAFEGCSYVSVSPFEFWKWRSNVST